MTDAVAPAGAALATPPTERATPTIVERFEIAGARPLVAVRSARGPEARLRTPRSGRVAAGLVAAAIVVLGTRWLWAAVHLTNPCRGAPEGARCVGPRVGFTVSQFVVALLATPVGVVVAAYYARFAAVGRIWRGRRVAGGLLGALVAIWIAIYVIGSFTIR